MRRVLGLVVIVLILGAAMTLLRPQFLTARNLTVVLDNMALEAIALSTITLLLIGGHFDLSVDGVAAMSGIIAGIAMNHAVPWPLACGLGVAIGCAVGLVNGLVVAKLRVNGLIGTLTTWWICVGISYGITRAIAPYNFPEAFQVISQLRIFGVRILVLYAIVAVGLLSFVLHYLPFGAHIYVAGDNRETCELLGIDTVRLGILLYVLVGASSGLIGVLMAARLDAASPVAVDGMTLRVIAGAVIGGCALSGGRGTIVGGLLGLLLMALLGNAIILLGISPYWQKALLGSILLAAVLSEQLNFKRRRIGNDKVVRLVDVFRTRSAVGWLRCPGDSGASHTAAASCREDRGSAGSDP